MNIFLSVVRSPRTPLPRASPSQVNSPASALVSRMAIFKRHLKHLKKWLLIPGTLWRVIQRETWLTKGNSKKGGNWGCEGRSVYRTEDRHRGFTGLLRALELCESNLQHFSFLICCCSDGSINKSNAVETQLSTAAKFMYPPLTPGRRMERKLPCLRKIIASAPLHLICNNGSKYTCREGICWLAFC